MQENNDLFDIKVSPETERELLETSKWSKLFGIFVFVICGIALLFILLAGGRLSEAMSSELGGAGGSSAFIGIMVVVVIVLAIVGVMMYFLLRAANRIKKGLELKNQAIFSDGLSDMKVYFTIYAVISILGLLGNLMSAF